MKNIKNIVYCCIIATSTVVLMPSCSDFLDEELTTSLSLQSFETPEGLDGLSTGMYQGLRFHFNYNWAYVTTNYGTDEFSVGGDRTEQMWNTYDASLNSLNVYAANVWDNMYSNIASANILIKNVPLYYGNLPNRDTRLGEGHFMRAFDYFKLVRQFGGVPLKLEPSVTVEFEFGRNTAAEVFDQIIKDFTEAYNLLPATPAEQGRITKWAAAHFLSKVYLTRASELYSDWNSGTKNEDLDNAIKYADIVINSGKHSLAKDFRELWNYTTVNGANEKLPEIILAAEFSNNTATQGRYGNQVHLYYPSIYQNLAGMQRDIPGGREFQRMRTTDYSMDVFDRVNDSRFWKSFKTSYSCNKPASAPVWEAKYAPKPELAGKPRFAGGQQSILYIVNSAGDKRYTEENIKYRAPHMFVRYFDGDSPNLMGEHGNYTTSRYVTMSKFLDGSRISVASQFGCRDGILARLAETYLIAAEAYGRKGQYDAALPYINAVRDRAAYKEGEDRTVYSDGGAAYKNNAVANTAQYTSYSEINSYYESNNIPVTTTASLSAMHLNSTTDIFNSTKEFYTEVGASSQAEKFLHFILNERSRELVGELLRWEDLSRTKTLVKRAKVFNDDTNPKEGVHYLRPIPQSFLDAIHKNGKPLSGEEKQAMQNPGY